MSAPIGGMWGRHRLQPGATVSAVSVDQPSDEAYRKAEARALTAICAVVPRADLEAVLTGYAKQNPSLDGATVEDVLSMAFANDHALGWTAPFAEIHKARLIVLRAELGVIDDLYGPGFLVGLSTLIHALMAGDIPGFTAVAATALGASKYWPAP